MFIYQLLLRNKAHFKSQMKATEVFIAIVAKLHGKALAKEFTNAPLSNSSGKPEKFKVVELAEQNTALEHEVQSLKAQLGLLNSPHDMMAHKNGTLKK